MQTLLNLLGYTANSILLLVVLILVADILIQNSLKKSGKDISTVPSGLIIRDTVKTILPFARKVVKIEDEDLLEKITAAIAVGLFVLIKAFIIR